MPVNVSSDHVGHGSGLPDPREPRPAERQPLTKGGGAAVKQGWASPAMVDPSSAGPPQVVGHPHVAPPTSPPETPDQHRPPAGDRPRGSTDSGWHFHRLWTIRRVPEGGHRPPAPLQCAPAGGRWERSNAVVPGRRTGTTTGRSGPGAAPAPSSGPCPGHGPGAHRHLQGAESLGGIGLPAPTRTFEVASVTNPREPKVAAPASALTVWSFDDQDLGEFHLHRGWAGSRAERNAPGRKSLGGGSGPKHGQCDVGPRVRCFFPVPGV